MIVKHFRKLKKSLLRQYREWRLPRGYIRLGTRYGGWWIDRSSLSKKPLLIDCGLGVDISFPLLFLQEFKGEVIGIDPNPYAIEYAKQNRVEGMEIIQKAFWSNANEEITFHMPKPLHELPHGADGVSGSVHKSHNYAGNESLQVRTTSLEEVLELAGRSFCDILKLDIEGAEYDVLSVLCLTGKIRKVDQLLVEFHHRITSHTFEDTLKAVNKVIECGFKLIHIDGRNYVFKKTL